MDKALILKNIGAIGKAALKLTASVQVTAVACAMHAVEHGDVTLADQLVDALGKGMRRASLRAWFEKQAPMYLPQGKTVFAFDKERAKELRKLSAEDLEAKLNSLAWEEAKPEAPVVSVFDVQDAFDKFMKRVEKQVAEAGVTVRNRELLEELSQTVAVYQAERVLGKRDTDESKNDADNGQIRTPQ